MRVISLISRNTQCLCLISRHFRHLFVRQGLTWRQLKYRKPGSGRGLWNGPYPEYFFNVLRTSAVTS